jgi:hypothetical protein
MLGLEAEELRDRSGRERLSLRGERVDRRSCMRPSTEVKVEIGQV